MKKLFSFLLILCATLTQATHNRAGEITYEWISGFTYKVTITTYTKNSSEQADRCSLEIFWGDTTSSILPRVNGPIKGPPCDPGIRAGVVIGNDVRKNVYEGFHTYPGTGAFQLRMEDPNRNGGVSNIPQSINVPFFITSEIFIANSLGGNNSPQLTNPPIDDGCQKRRFEHNPGAVDPDGDSLYYELVDCRGAGGAALTSTYNPQFVQDPVRIDSITGDLIWDVPQNVGQFNFAIKITEWRRKATGSPVKLGFVTRDLQVDIKPCDDNDPPVIQPVGPFCVEAGTALNFTVTATDPDNDELTLRAFGGPFDVPQPADTFFDRGTGSASANFNWNTQCLHVRKQPYFVTFEAKDFPQARNSAQPSLVDIYTTDITVVAPSPKNPLANANGEKIDLSWDASICNQASGYKIYRREGTYGFVPAPCETGVPGYTGYEQIGTTEGLNNTTFSDTMNLIRGVEYCYMVVACFDDGAESYASVEFCTNLVLNAPMMTRVDVLSTDVASGEVEVRWIPPPILDTLNFPPPYSYKLYRSDGISGNDFAEIQTLNGLFDTSFTDQNLNTQDSGFRYKVELYYGAAASLLAESNPASSIFLRITPSDESVILRMTHNTPWRNDEFVIFKETAPGSGVFNIFDTAFSATYTDSGLVNGETYCYRTLGIGAYTASDSLPSPLLNNSQIACGTPIDTTAPCAPEVSGYFECENDTLYLEWNYPVDSACANDITAFRVYYKPTLNDEFPSEPLAVFIGQNSFVLSGEPVVGCYAITALDDAANDPGGQTNESIFSEIFCVEPCPEIQFPNVFTPNGDGTNDFFRPINHRNIGEMNISIYNRWGNLVYRAPDSRQFLDEGWDGLDQNSGEVCSDGVYFYNASYSPLSLEIEIVREQSGFLHLLSGTP